MATGKENLEKWLLIQALLKNEDYDAIREIAEKMIKELETVPD